MSPLSRSSLDFLKLGRPLLLGVATDPTDTIVRLVYSSAGGHNPWVPCLPDLTALYARRDCLGGAAAVDPNLRFVQISCFLGPFSPSVVGLLSVICLQSNISTAAVLLDTAPLSAAADLAIREALCAASGARCAEAIRLLRTHPRSLPVVQRFLQGWYANTLDMLQVRRCFAMLDARH
eukprot:gnl/Ergobibamus_cyprinoides/1634.p1 GENE.gnl/Ergobibamus_cyprinoides/1634~~gnl/Ergobibamus_cyprinoides/1634.p1  ORF type:complete len:178 (+),score=14.74 gnl/Ergobibamus_cyprinoides/1634:207-740(+)